MSEVKKNRECTIKTLEKLENTWDLDSTDPDIVASHPFQKKSETLWLKVIFNTPHTKFEEWIGQSSPEISEEEKRPLIDTLNKNLENCIKKSKKL